VHTQSVKTGPNIINTTLGRLSLGRKVLMGGGFEHVFIHRFGSLPNEKLVDAYTCFLSSSAGPIAGTLFITTERIVFGSDWPLPYHPAPRETMWSYYNVCAYISLYILCMRMHAQTDVVLACQDHFVDVKIF
jgi:peptidoglycan biosynthesis protein MviN/MurJ (putative lipid II flippase)